MTVAIKIDSFMLSPAPELSLYELAAVAFTAAGIDSFSLCCPHEIFQTVKSAFPDNCIRSDTLQGDIVIDKPMLITKAGARALINGDRAGILKGCIPITDACSLFEAQKIASLATIEEHLKNGVRFWDSAGVYIDPRTSIGAGSVVLPGTIIKGCCSIGQNCTLGPNSVIDSCTLADNVTVNHSQINFSTIGSHTAIGPFAYIRPDCTIGADCKIGDFVEVKNSTVGNKTKFSHLTYVGDSDVGNGVNLGCGTVTVNYDGINKFRTTVKDGAFVGCNTNIIAPVTVGADAYVGAGSTLTQDVPDGALAIARARQVIKQEQGRGRTKRTEHHN